jgi:hypothetical protein
MRSGDFRRAILRHTARRSSGLTTIPNGMCNSRLSSASRGSAVVVQRTTAGVARLDEERGLSSMTAGDAFSSANGRMTRG